MVIFADRSIAPSVVHIFYIRVTSTGRFAQITRADWSNGLKKRCFYPDRWPMCGDNLLEIKGNIRGKHICYFHIRISVIERKGIERRVGANHPK
jgi:hypothetical protein